MTNDMTQYCYKKNEMKLYNSTHENMFCSHANHQLQSTRFIAKVQLCLFSSIP